MAMWLKQSTTVTIKFGPLVDATNGNTPETGEATNMDSATTGIRVAKAGGDMGDRNSATAPTHDEVGIYNVELNATDTATLGMLKVSYDGSTVCLPHWMEFMVVPANVWDSMFGADNLDVNTAQVGGQTASASGTVTFPAATLASTTNITAGTIATVTNTVTADIDTIKTQAVTCAAGVTINPSVGAATIQPTVTQFDARTLTAASYATPTNITAGTITTVTNLTNAPTSGDLTATMKTSVNAEIVDALNTDTITLPGQEAPPLAPTHREAVGWLYKVLRNRTDQTATLWQLYADDESTVDAKATVSDNGTTATVQEIVTGP